MKINSVLRPTSIGALAAAAVACHSASPTSGALRSPPVAAQGDAPQKEALEQNKRTVVAFYTRTFNDKDPEGAARAYLGNRYVQHNPVAADGVDGFLAFVHASQGRAPQLHAEIKRVMAEGDLVFMHTRMTIPGGITRSVMDIFRLEAGKIVEHWDTIQVVPETSANNNTMF